MANIQRQAQEEREQMACEMRERDALYLADAQRKQKAIDQLTEALSATLSRLPTASPAVASGGAPPPPPGGGNAPRDGGRRAEGKATEGTCRFRGQFQHRTTFRLPLHEERAAASPSGR